jgi:hypothetical protein
MDQSIVKTNKNFIVLLVLDLVLVVCLISFQFLKNKIKKLYNHSFFEDEGFE